MRAPLATRHGAAGPGTAPDRSRRRSAGRRRDGTYPRYVTRASLRDVTTAAPPSPAPSPAPPRPPGPPGFLLDHGVAALALLSVIAGLLHATVVEPHRGHGIVATLFTAAAVFQIAWGALVLAKPSRPVIAAGVVTNLAFVGAWILTRTTGVGFIDGFEEVEVVGFTDAAIAGLEAALIAVGALRLVAPARRLWPAGSFGGASFAAVGLVVALVSVQGAVKAVDQSAPGHHDGAAGAGQEEAAGHEGAGHEGAGHEDAAGDEDAAGHGGGAHGDLDVDTEAATPEEEAAASELLAETKDGLWQWNDAQARYDAGFRSIGDGGTGIEHEVNWNWIDDDVALDPDKPESLVFRVAPDGKKVLEAAMFMARPGASDEDIPDVGGPITQWHIHNNLCYAPAEDVAGFPERRVVGLTNAEGTCDRGEYLQPHAPMLHVWVVPHECGPFSSLEGVGAGQAVSEELDPNADPDCQHSE